MINKTAVKSEKAGKIGVDRVKEKINFKIPKIPGAEFMNYTK